MAEPKKKIVIKKKRIIRKTATPPTGSENEGLPEDTPAPKLKVPAKKMQITKKKKVSPSSTQPQPPPPEVIATSEIEAPAVERQKTMIAPPPIGAATHTNEKIEKKETYKFYCIRCGQKLEAYYDWVGRSIGCPRCKVSITIPEPLA